MNYQRSGNHRSAARMRKVGTALLATLAAVSLAGNVAAQDHQDKEKDVVRFDLAPVPQFLDCLRANKFEEPRIRGTVVHGTQNDTLILDMDGIKPDLTLSVFSTERTFFTAAGVKDPEFHGFGLSWYQSDISTPKRSDDGHVRLQTILLNETFGFDPDVNLHPTNTFHVGLWFDDPQDAVACGFVPNPDPNSPARQFNGEHNSGPLAFATVPDVNGLGPLCTEPNTTTTPATCGEATPAALPH
ncbi:MAG TPA: hypothetical protein VJP87_05545 [Candidatus Acidoferrales bacterium]|nr:hypothetical protein [Candidatus Acidoferrales bacterium]